MTIPKRKKRKLWSEPNVAYLKKNARKKPVRSIAAYLRRSVGAVKQKAQDVGISLDTR